MAASHDGDADFDTDAPLEGENTKRNDLWKLDHVIALIWTGIMGILSLAIIGLIILNVVMIGYVAITEKNNEQLDAVASKRTEPVNGYCWSGHRIELRTHSLQTLLMFLYPNIRNIFINVHNIGYISLGFASKF